MDFIKTILDFAVAVVSFIVSAVILKGIVAHWLADRITEQLRAFISDTKRGSAILSHFSHKHVMDIEECSAGDCATAFS